MRNEARGNDARLGGRGRELEMPLEGPISEEEAFRRRLNSIMNDCAIDHPLIERGDGIFGGIPHLAGLRLSIGDILAQVYALGSIKAVVDYYAPYVTEEQIKEAIAYAQDFLEAALDPHQANG